MSDKTSPRSTGMLVRWATFAVRNKWRVVGAWVAIAAIAIGLNATVGTDYSTAFEVPGTDAQRAADLLEERFPSAAGDSATVVFQADAGVDDPAVRTRIEAFLAEAATLPGVVGVASPYQGTGTISADGTIAYASLRYDASANDVATEDVERMLNLVDGSAGNGLRVEAGGQIARAVQETETSTSELIGIGVAMVILLLMFGSIIAMGLPIVTALLGLGLALVLAPVVANVFTLNDGITAAFLAMMGLGVGIDYALFILNRYRDGLLDGLSVEDAVVRAINTSGRAVAFAGTTVAIGLLGLAVIGIPFVTGIGISGALVVMLSVLIALFLVPALLALVGRSVIRWRIPGLGRRAEGQRSFWWTWGRTIQRWPAAIAAAVLALLIVAIIPFFDMQLGLSDDGNDPTSTHTRRAYDLLSAGFGPGVNGPLLLVLERDGGIAADTLNRVTSSLEASAGVAAVAPAMVNQAGDTAIVQIFPTTSPQDEATGKLVDRLRDDVLPQTLDGSATNALIGGATATNIDMSDKISSRMPLFFSVVIGLSMLLLTMVFRSVVIPVKAALLNLLTVGAAYGALVAVFQWGWGKDLLGIAKEGPVESYLPMMLFGIIFGLSMDYELFLLTRVQEEYQRHGDSRLAMLTGVGSTGRVVAAAGAIMAAVFFAFVLGDDRVIKEFGLGLGVAIVVDAYLIRLVLVPAVMTLLGDRAWYIPRWLDRLLPRLTVETPQSVAEPVEGDVPRDRGSGAWTARPRPTTSAA